MKLYIFYEFLFITKFNIYTNLSTYTFIDFKYLSDFLYSAINGKIKLINNILLLLSPTLFTKFLRTKPLLLVIGPPPFYSL